MSVQKYGYRDPDFYIKMRGAAWNDESRAVAIIFELTGMHPQSLTELEPVSLKMEGSDWTLYWKRPKTHKLLNRIIPKDDLEDVRRFLGMRRHSYWHYWDVVRRLGQKAGFETCSPMSYRHQRCITMLGSGYSVPEVAHLMGCTPDVVLRNYSKMKEWGMPFERHV